ncbi:DUF1330 domain-containing protein [Thalassotalea sp. PLHSN55]|uniref:DUF1330 domain-containing protein n=1 Tax=Thalassotalea sp. PLHSN55 TaxID=3435888 RepID=UPI003F867CD9
MAYERIMAIDVSNDEIYDQYRKHMKPILRTYGGEFGFDFRIAEVLQSKTNDPINRVFTLSFPSKDAMEAFFTDAKYLAVKKQYFEPSVSSTTVISLHQTQE